MSVHTHPEIGRASDPADEESISLPTWTREADPLQPIPSHSRYAPPELVVTSRRRARSQAAWYANAAMGHSIGLGYLVLTLRELSGLSQSRLAKRADLATGDRSSRVGPSRPERQHASEDRIGVRDASGRRAGRPGARCGRPVHARPDAPRDPAAVLGRPPGLLRHPRAATMGRRRLGRNGRSPAKDEPRHGGALRRRQPDH